MLLLFCTACCCSLAQHAVAVLQCCIACCCSLAQHGLHIMLPVSTAAGQGGVSTAVLHCHVQWRPCPASYLCLHVCGVYSNAWVSVCVCRLVKFACVSASMFPRMRHLFCYVCYAAPTVFLPSAAVGPVLQRWHGMRRVVLRLSFLQVLV